jgi:hypothetical protein
MGGIRWQSQARRPLRDRMAGGTVTATQAALETNIRHSLTSRTWRWILASVTGPSLLPLMLAAALAVGFVEAVLGYRFVQQHGLIDGDNYMRLVRIRDGLHTGWFTHVVANDNAGSGTVVYWSHVIDALVLLVRLPLLLVLPGQDALFVAGATTASLIAGAFAAVLVWVPSPLVARRWLWTGPAIALLSMAIRTYGTWGNIHHHLPLAMTAILAAGWAGRATSGRIDASIWCGLWAAIALWISPEALPYVLMAIGVIGVAWCQKPAALAPCLAICGTTFAATIVVAVLCDPPYGGWLSPEVDCLSVVYVVFAAGACATAWLLAALGRYTSSVWMRALCAVVVCSAVLGVWLWLYPNIIHGLSGLVPSSEVQAYFGAIAEMRHLRLDAHDTSLLVSGSLAVLVAIYLAVVRCSLLWAYAATCGLIIVALAASYIRFLVYAETIAAVMLPIAVEAAGRMQGSPTAARMLRVVVLAAFFLGPQLPLLAAPRNENSKNIMANCRIPDILPALREQNAAVVLTEISDTPEILWRSSARTVGSFYHRSIGAFILARNAWRSLPTDSVPQAVTMTGATHILACDFTSRPPLVADLPPVTLQDRLMQHDVPPWLHEVAHAGGYSLYALGH